MFDVLKYLVSLYKRSRRSEPPGISAHIASGQPEVAAQTALPPFVEIKRVTLGPHHLQPAGVGVTIYEGGKMEPKPPFSGLKVMHFVGEESCYVFHIAQNGESTDTFHESLGEALRDVEETYGVKESEWIDVDAPLDSKNLP